MMKLQKIFALLLALAMLSACGSTTESEELIDAPDESTEAVVLEEAEVEADEPLIPEYEMTTLVYDELIASDGTLIAMREYTAPVYKGDGEVANMLNEIFAAGASSGSMEEFQWALDEYEADSDGYLAEMIEYGASGANSLKVAESYRNEQYVSFCTSGYWYGFGAHGGNIASGMTIDVLTGETLSILDVLNLDANTMADTLYNEAVDYFNANDTVYAELVVNPDYKEAIVSRCGEDAIFWLDADGIHIYFDEYTFFYAVGARSLVIPYTRTDLFKEPFAVVSDINATAPVTTPDVDAYKDAYSQIISDNYADIAEYESVTALFGDEPSVAIYNLVGDDTPELAYITFPDGIWRLSVYTYDDEKGAVCLLDALELGVCAGGPTFEVSALSDGRLLIRSGNSSGDGYYYAYDNYGLVDGEYIMLDELYHEITMSFAEGVDDTHLYVVSDSVSDEATYTAALEEVLSQVCLNMFKLCDPDFADSEIMFVDGALTYLS